MLTKQEFGTLIRTLRMHRKISLRKFAEIVGISPSYLSMVERGETTLPTEDTIVKIAQALDYDTDELLGYAGKIASDVKQIILQDPSRIAKIIRNLK
jgi:transcriptional regulator with XRE-family HTH domain